MPIPIPLEVSALHLITWLFLYLYLIKSDHVGSELAMNRRQHDLCITRYVSLLNLSKLIMGSVCVRFITGKINKTKLINKLGEFIENWRVKKIRDTWVYFKEIHGSWNLDYYFWKILVDSSVRQVRLPTRERRLVKKTIVRSGKPRFRQFPSWEWRLFR